MNEELGIDKAIGEVAAEVQRVERRIDQQVAPSIRRVDEKIHQHEEATTDEHAKLHGLDSGVNDGIRRLANVEQEIVGFDVALRQQVDLTVEKFEEYNKRARQVEEVVELGALEVQRVEVQRVERRIDEQVAPSIRALDEKLFRHEEHAAEKIYATRVQVAEREIIALRAKLQIFEVALNTLSAAAEESANVAMSIIESIRARLDGHDLAFVTMGLDEEGREKLGRMLRREPKPIIFESDWEEYAKDGEAPVAEQPDGEEPAGHVVCQERPTCPRCGVEEGQFHKSTVDHRPEPGYHYGR